jgi:hypothetical protein
LNGKWEGQGNCGEDFLREEHPYQADLNILGRGSIFELLATTRSAAGAERLAAYLLDPTDIATVHARQAAVAELLPQTELRESVALAGSYAFQECDPRALRNWLKTPVLQVAAVVPAFLCLTSTCSLALGMPGPGRPSHMALRPSISAAAARCPSRHPSAVHATDSAGARERFVAHSRKDVLYQFSFFLCRARNWRSPSSVGEAGLAATCCDG